MCVWSLGGGIQDIFSMFKGVEAIISLLSRFIHTISWFAGVTW